MTLSIPYMFLNEGKSKVLDRYQSLQTCYLQIWGQHGAAWGNSQRIQLSREALVINVTWFNLRGGGKSDSKFSFPKKSSSLNFENNDMLNKH